MEEVSTKRPHTASLDFPMTLQGSKPVAGTGQFFFFFLRLMIECVFLMK